MDAACSKYFFKKKVLITGGTGFIGSHLFNKLEEYGADIKILVRSREKIPRGNENYKLYVSDLLNEENLEKAVKGVTIVFHLVAKTHNTSTSSLDYHEYHRVNVEGTKLLLEKAAKEKVKHFIYFSSIKAIGEYNSDGSDRGHAPNPMTVYGKTKFKAEKLIKEFGEEHDVATTIIRLPLVYGPGNKGNIKKIIEAIDTGKFIQIGNGCNRRSMVYVLNVVDAALHVVSSNKNQSGNYIVTDGIDPQLKEVYQIIYDFLGKKKSSFYVPLAVAWIFAKIGDIVSSLVKRQVPFNSEMLKKLTKELVYSCGDIEEETGFKPKYSLRSGMADTIGWYKENRYSCDYPDIS